MAAPNHGARGWMDTTGRLCGPELVCPGGCVDRAADQIVTLTPGTDGTLVTSQRAVIPTSSERPRLSVKAPYLCPGQLHRALHHERRFVF